MKALKTLNSVKTAVGSMLALMMLTPSVSLAQGGYNNGGYNNGYQDNRYGQEPYISIYEDCDFRGARRDVSVGEFRTMRELDFGNDNMSSIQVPKELEAVIFEHDGFRGSYARIDRDVRCFDNSWNDEASSLRVEYTKKRHQPNRNDSRASNRNGNRNNDGLIYGENNQRDGHRGRDVRRNLNDGVTGKTVSQVVFDNRVLQQVNDRQWHIQDYRRGLVQYVEVRRDDSNVYLENQRTSEKLRIDLFANDVTIVKPRGAQQRFMITSRKGQIASAPRPRTPPVVSGPSRRIASDCFDFRAFTTGGAGGVRFHGKDGFHRFDTKPSQGRICHNGSLTMEINKTDPNTQVVVEIEGRRFVFAKGEKETSFKNSWYRKKVALKVGR